MKKLIIRLFSPIDRSLQPFYPTRETVLPDRVPNPGSMYSTLYPLTIKQAVILDSARLTSKLITLEEHGIGGLGTIVSEVLAEIDEAVKFTPMRLPRQAVSTAGSQNYWREKNQLSLNDLTNLIADQYE